MQETEVASTESNSDVVVNVGDLSESARKAQESEAESAPEAKKEAKADAEAKKPAGETGEEEDTSQSGDEEEGHEPDDEDEEGEQHRGKKRGGFKRRIDKLTKRLSEKEAEIEHWRKEALRSKDAGPVKQDEIPQKEAVVGDKPDPDEFDTHDDYVEALTEYKLEKKLAERAQKEGQEKLKAQFQERISKHQERVAEFAEKTEDFADVIEDVDDIPMSLAVQELILDSDNGPELMYELAKDPAEYKRICSLSPLAAARAVGRIEAKLSPSPKEVTKKPIKTTKAPHPIAPLGGKGAPQTKSLSEMDYEEYRKVRLEQMKKSRR